MLKRNDHQLTIQQYRAVIMLARGDRPGKVAKELKIHPGSLSRWRKNRTFQKKYHACVQRLFESGLSDLQAQVGKALEWIHEAHDDPNAVVGDRLKATKLLLDSALKAHEFAVLKKELAEVAEFKAFVSRALRGDIGDLQKGVDWTDGIA